MKPVPVLIGLVFLGAALAAVGWLRQVAFPPATQQSKYGDLHAEAEAWKQNPLDVPGAGPYPRAVLDNYVYEFGVMELGQEDSYAFVVRNEGEAPLKLEVGMVQCKCTVAAVAEDGIPPGESAEVNVSWKPKEYSWEFQQKAEIWTNDPENPKLELLVKGSVMSMGIVLPQGEWPLTRIRKNVPPQFAGVLVSPILEEFQILGHELSTDLLTVKFEPIVEEELEGLETVSAQSGYKIMGTLQGTMPVGQFRATLTVMTDMQGGRDFTIPITASNPGPFPIMGSGWFGGDRLLKMGDVTSSEGKTVTLSMYAAREKEPLQLEVKKTDPDFLKLEFERDESFNVPTREKIYMIFTVPPGSPLGSWQGDDRATILIGTNRDSARELELNVEMIVQE